MAGDTEFVLLPAWHLVFKSIDLYGFLNKLVRFLIVAKKAKISLWF